MSHDRLEALEDGQELFAVVAGVRRQTACAILNLIEALGFDRTWGMPADAKPVVKHVSQQLTQFVVKEGRYLDSIVAFSEQHTKTLAQEYDENQSFALVDNAMDCFRAIYNKYKDKEFEERKYDPPKQPQQQPLVVIDLEEQEEEGTEEEKEEEEKVETTQAAATESQKEESDRPSSAQSQLKMFFQKTRQQRELSQTLQPNAKRQSLIWQIEEQQPIFIQERAVGSSCCITF